MAAIKRRMPDSVPYLFLEIIFPFSLLLSFRFRATSRRLAFRIKQGQHFQQRRRAIKVIRKHHPVLFDRRFAS
jgi:hypothetical protein